MSISSRSCVQEGFEVCTLQAASARAGRRVSTRAGQHSRMGDELDLPLDDETIDLVGDEGLEGAAVTPPPAEDMPRWASLALTLSLLLFFFRRQILERLSGRAGPTNTTGGGHTTAPAMGADEMSALRLKRLQGLGAPASDDASESELRRRARPAADALEPEPEPAAPATDSAAAEAARIRHERDEKLRRRVAEMNAEAEKKEHRRKSAAARDRADKQQATARAPTQQEKQPSSAATERREKPTPKPTMADVPMGKVAHVLGTRLDAASTDHKAELELTLTDALATQGQQGGPAQQLRFIAHTCRVLGTEKRAAKQADDSLHMEMADGFEKTLIKALSEVIQTSRASFGDVLVSNLKSDTVLSPQLLGAALESLGSRSDSGLPDLNAAWAAVQGTFGRLWADIRGPVDGALCERMAGIDSPMSSLSAMVALFSAPVVPQAMAANIANAPWIPQRRLDPMRGRKPAVMGRDLELVFLGPLFGLGIIPDATRKLNRSQTAWLAGKIGEFFFPNGFRRRQIEIDGDVEIARDQVQLVQDQLVRVTKLLLRKDRGSREHMLNWLHHAVECNANKAKVYADHANDSSDNFTFNIAFVLLRLCEPFMSGSSSKVAPTIESEFAVRCARYVEDPEHQCSYEAETKFACETGELDAWVDKRNLARIKQFEAAKKKAAAAQAKQPAETPQMHGVVRSGKARDAAATPSDESDEDAMDALLREEEPEGQSDAASGKTAAPLKQSFSFVTEIFFLTARALHHGFIPSMNVSDRGHPHSASTYYKLLHAMNPLAKMLNEMRGARHPELEGVYSQMFATKLCYDAMMLDPRFLELGLKFYSLCSRWLTKLACGIDEMDETDVDLSKLDLPLKLPVPMAFATLPEFFGTDCCEYLLLLAELKGSVLFNASDEFDRILSLLVVLLESPGYVRNPHLRMKFVAVIALLIPPKAPKRGSEEERPDFSQIFNVNVIAKRYLAPSLIRLYVDIENTGSHNQFHEKVQPRYNVYCILEHCCDPVGSAARASADSTTIAHPPDPVYRTSLFGYLSEGSDMAKKFISMLLGDTQLHFDDGLLKLAEAKKLQDEQDSGEWESLPASTSGPGEPPAQGSREEKTKQLDDAENHARHLLNQTSKTIHFLAYVTLDCPGPFLAGIFVHRIAQMLNSFIVKLAGRNMGALKVRNMDDLEFKPLELLDEVASVFVHLFQGSVAEAEAEPAPATATATGASTSPFVTAMLSMGQYDADIYRKALRILTSKQNPNYRRPRCLPNIAQLSSDACILLQRKGAPRQCLRGLAGSYTPSTQRWRRKLQKILTWMSAQMSFL